MLYGYIIRQETPLNSYPSSRMIWVTVLFLNCDAPILFSFLYNVQHGDVIGGVLHQPYI
jgi:hypothetical protein